MYDKEGKIIDRREMLRVKVKTLAEEARIIRREEQRSHGPLRNELREHRAGVLRSAARDAHIAYGLLKGRTYEQMEGNRRPDTKDPNLDAIRKMLARYGKPGWQLNTVEGIRYEAPVAPEAIKKEEAMTA